MNRFPFLKLLFVVINLLPLGLAYAQQRTPIHDPLAALRKPTSSKTSTHNDTPAFDIQMNWDAVQGRWDTIHQFTTTYFPDGSKLSQDYATYAQGVYTPVQHYDFYKDTAGVDGMTIRKNYSNGNWVNEVKWTQYLNPQGDFRNDMTYSWSGSTWDSSSTFRQYLTYGSSNQLLNTETLAWENWQSGFYKEKVDYHYNSQLLPDTITFWDFYNTWRLKRRMIDLSWYDHSLFLTSQFTEQMHDQITWNNQYRYTNTYGANNGVEQLTEYYLLPAGVWQNLYRSLKRNDEKGHETYSEFSTWIGYFPFDGYDSTEYVYDIDGNTIESIFRQADTLALHNRVRHLYGDFFTGAGTPVLPPSMVSAFPNPATDAVYFDLGDTQHGRVDIVLYDVQGRKLLETSTIYNGMAIRVPLSERLAQATYIYRVFARGGVSEGKVIVQR